MAYCPWPRKTRFSNAREASEALIKAIKRAQLSGEESYPRSFYECHNRHGGPGCGGWHFSSSDDARPRVLSVGREASRRGLK